MCLAIAAKLVSRDDNRGVAATEGRSFDVSLVTLPEAVPGDNVLVSLGMALEVITDEEASAIRDAWSIEV
jgi:hydrogenase assembly chaperone HypC/HupF